VHAFDAKQLTYCVLKVLLSTEEENALYIAILLHDIGHGPFHMPWKKHC
jgi:HD superfamily phosphohydrolase